MLSKAFFDSNVFIFGFERPRSNSRRILDLLVDGELRGVVTDRVVREVMRYMRRYYGKDLAGRFRDLMLLTCDLLLEEEPIRVELSALGIDEFLRILTEPSASLTEQYRSLLATERVALKFDPSGIRRIAEVAFQVNERSENIGARRLHTVLERLLEAVSFEAADRGGQTVVVDAAYVDGHLGELVKDEDLSRYIL